MRIYETAVKKPISTLLIFLGVVLLGLYSFQKLPVDFYPDINPPYITVLTYYTGANAFDIETNVSRILEDNLNSVSNLKKITSESLDNVSVLSLEFEWGSNLDEAINNVRDVLGRVESQLPEGAQKPIVVKFNTSMIPILTFSVTAKESFAALPKIIEDEIVNPLNRINGIGAIAIQSGGKREVAINVDPVQMAAYNLTVEQIGAAVKRENLNLPGGAIDQGNTTLPIRIQGEFNASDEIGSIIVGNYNGRTIRLSDVARVVDTTEEAKIIEHSNGERAVTLSVQKQSGANTVEVVHEILTELPRLEKNLPPDVKLNLMFNSSEFIENSVRSLSDAIMYAGIFVMLVVLFFLGRWRATFIIILTIPVSLIVSFVYLYLSGATINIISLSSLSIAIGMVVDDAIVVLENISTHIDRGSSPREAAIYGTNEVSLSVVASTLTVLAVFLPLTMVGGFSGILFRQLGFSVSIVVTVSTVAALTLTPMLSAQLLKSRDKRSSKKGLFQRFRERVLSKLDDAYLKTLGWATRHRAWLLVIASSIFIGSLFLVPLVRTEYMPLADNSYITVTAKLPNSVRLSYTEAIVQKIEDQFEKTIPEIKVLTCSFGTPGKENLFAASKANGPHVIMMQVVLVRPDMRKRHMNVIGDQIRQELANFPELESIKVTPGGANGGPGGAAQIDVEISGYDLETTGRIAYQMAENMRKIEGTRDVKVDQERYRPDYTIKFDRDKLAAAGLSTATAAQFVRNRMFGLLATKFREKGDEYDVVVRYDKSHRESLQDIRNIMLMGPTGQSIKLSDVAIIEEHMSPPSISHNNRQRVIKVTTGMSQGGSMSQIVKEIWKSADELEIPDGVAISIGGSAKDQAEANSDLSLLFLLVVILVYIVMASQFESLREPFIIMLSLPFAFTGVFLSLFLFNEALSLISMIGAIMLVGIVVKNGIVLIDYINLLRNRGMTTITAVIEGSMSRLRPVLMTSLTTILGMVPLAFSQGEGSETWRPMGLAVMGGLTFSTMLTLLVIPVVYIVFSASTIRRRRKRSLKLARKQSI